MQQVFSYKIRVTSTEKPFEINEVAPAHAAVFHSFLPPCCQQRIPLVFTRREHGVPFFVGAPQK
ncbi:MAG: hypothetical protein QUS14_00390 [Pyrinomonadaceae bacterium]|nr:hypothetical protein [Pyrinomonadaceae bacterium]